MAAPSTVYSTNKLPVSGSTTTTLPLALNLGTYTNIKEHFYLDKIFRVEEDFIGMVKSGSTNYSYHNTDRFSKVRAKDESNGDVYLICNDGGLNTLPTVSELIVSSPFKIDNTIGFGFKSAYYLTSSNYGLEFNINNDGFDEVSFGSLLSNSTNYGSTTLPSTASVGDYVVVRAYIENEEGIRRSSNQDFYVRPNVFYIKHPTYSSAGGYLNIVVNLVEDNLKPITLEEDIDVVVRVTFTVGDIEDYIDYNLTISAYGTSGEITLNKNSEFGSGTIINGVTYVSHFPIYTSDGVSIDDYNTPYPTVYYLRLERINEGVGFNYIVYLEDEEGNPVISLDDISIAVRQYYKETDESISEYITINSILYTDTSTNDYDFTYREPGVDFGADVNDVVVEGASIFSYSPNVSGGISIEIR